MERWLSSVGRVVRVAVLVAVGVAGAWAIHVSFVQHLLTTLAATAAHGVVLLRRLR